MRILQPSWSLCCRKSPPRGPARARARRGGAEGQGAALRLRPVPWVRPQIRLCVDARGVCCVCSLESSVVCVENETERAEKPRVALRVRG